MLHHFHFIAVIERRSTFISHLTIISGVTLSVPLNVGHLSKREGLAPSVSVLGRVECSSSPNHACVLLQEVVKRN